MFVNVKQKLLSISVHKALRVMPRWMSKLHNINLLLAVANTHSTDDDIFLALILLYVSLSVMGRETRRVTMTNAKNDTKK